MASKRMNVIIMCVAAVLAAAAGVAIAGVAVGNPGKADMSALEEIFDKCESNFIKCTSASSAPKCDEQLMKCVETWANLVPGDMYIPDPMYTPLPKMHAHGAAVEEMAKKVPSLGRTSGLDASDLRAKAKGMKPIGDDDDGDDDQIPGDMYAPSPSEPKIPGDMFTPSSKLKGNPGDVGGTAMTGTARRQPPPIPSPPKVPPRNPEEMMKPHIIDFDPAFQYNAGKPIPAMPTQKAGKQKIPPLPTP